MICVLCLPLLISYPIKANEQNDEKQKEVGEKRDGSEYSRK